MHFQMRFRISAQWSCPVLGTQALTDIGFLGRFRGGVARGAAPYRGRQGCPPRNFFLLLHVPPSAERAKEAGWRIRPPKSLHLKGTQAPDTELCTQACKQSTFHNTTLPKVKH